MGPRDLRRVSVLLVKISQVLRVSLGQYDVLFVLHVERKLEGKGLELVEQLAGLVDPNAGCSVLSWIKGIDGRITAIWKLDKSASLPARGISTGWPAKLTRRDCVSDRLSILGAGERRFPNEPWHNPPGVGHTV